jgi:hypothetical protein
MVIKNEAAWEGHLGSKGHRANVGRLKELERKEEEKRREKGKRKADNQGDVQMEVRAPILNTISILFVRLDSGSLVGTRR